jgi:peptidoglycan hydrolase-like protein with peptidoglycan-binding domain
MKRLLIVIGIGAVVLWLVGPFHEGIGELFQSVTAPSPERQAVKPTFPPPLSDVQLALREAGFDPGPVDGRMGRRTRSALKAFQSTNGLKQTGEVTRETWAALQALSSEPPTKLASATHEQQRPVKAETVSLPAQESDAIGATEAGEAFPSISKEETRAAIMEYRLRSPDRIKKVQLALREAGFDPGPIDGELGPRTDQALRSFQRANGLESDGIVGVKTWSALSEYLEPGSLHAQERAALHD